MTVVIFPEGDAINSVMRLLVVILAALATAAAAAKQMTEPGELALVLNEDDFEDYLDAWLENEHLKRNVSASAAVRNGITFLISFALCYN